MTGRRAGRASIRLILQVGEGLAACLRKIDGAGSIKRTHPSRVLTRSSRS